MGCTELERNQSGLKLLIHMRTDYIAMSALRRYHLLDQKEIV